MEFYIVQATRCDCFEQGLDECAKCRGGVVHKRVGFNLDLSGTAEVTAKQVNQAHAQCSLALVRAKGDEATVYHAKFELEQARTRHILAGLAGKNQVEREAQLRRLTQKELVALKQAEENAIASKMAYELARIELRLEQMEALLEDSRDEHQGH